MGDVINNIPPINERLKALRKEAGYSYKKLEDLTGISRSTLQRYELNQKANIPSNKLAAIAKAYQVSEIYLLGYENRDMSMQYFQPLLPLLKELGYNLQYDSHKNTYELWIESPKNDGTYSSVPISNEQIRNLKETSLSYLKFKINEIISSQEPPIVN